MRISDGSSDVGSSDLSGAPAVAVAVAVGWAFAVGVAVTVAVAGLARPERDLLDESDVARVERPLEVAVAGVVDEAAVLQQMADIALLQRIHGQVVFLPVREGVFELGLRAREFDRPGVEGVARVSEFVHGG